MWKAIIHRIIDHYFKYGHTEFYIALGYKGSIIKKYFKDIKLKKLISINWNRKKYNDWWKIKRLKKFLNEPFYLPMGMVCQM